MSIYIYILILGFRTMTARPDINVDLATLNPSDHIRYDHKHHGIITNVNIAGNEYGVILFSIDGITGNETLDTVEWDHVVKKFRCGEFVKILHDYELKNHDEELDCLDGPTGVPKSEDEFTKYKNDDIYIDVIHKKIKRQLSSKVTNCFIGEFIRIPESSTKTQNYQKRQI